MFNLPKAPLVVAGAPMPELPGSETPLGYDDSGWSGAYVDMFT